MRHSLIRFAIAALVVCALIPRRAAEGQVATTVAPSTAWTTSTQMLGIENFRCDCTISTSSDSKRRFVFRSEPTVLGVARRGPSYGILYRGDVITHVDGYSILSAEGARRFSSIDAGDDVDLTFKRNGRAMKASIHAEEAEPNGYVLAPEAPGGYSIGWDATPTPAIPATPPVAPMATVPAMPAVPAAPRVRGVWPTPAVPAIPAIPAVPRGWFGFSIRCNGCGWAMSPGQSPVWESDEPPELAMVAVESPAGRAGLRAGDRLTHIDGLSLLTREGARRFGRVKPGERVRLTLKRGNATLTRELTLLTRPEVRAALAAASPRAATTVRPSLRRELRYTGDLDNVSVEVWSTGGPTVEKIGDTMVITTGSSVVRIKVDPKKSRD
ncbi:MAG TPA: PDZ domain-containing protein [Gemmatimonadaceae bacterium]|nr:PDZ domain-containing protein [Gemmatimonadaceae bacterium]